MNGWSRAFPAAAGPRPGRACRVAVLFTQASDGDIRPCALRCVQQRVKPRERRLIERQGIIYTGLPEGRQRDFPLQAAAHLE